MPVWELILIGIGLSMDAFAVGMTDGMAEPRMKPVKIFLIAGAFALFQFLMPVVGYYFGYLFSDIVEKFAPWISFALLAFIGGKMIFDFVKENVQRRRESGTGTEETPRKLGVLTLLIQAVATSVDAFAVGVTFLAAETAEGLPMHVVLCALVIGGITFSLSAPAVLIGKKAGNKLSDKAELIGGLILVGIGLKILIEALV